MFYISLDYYLLSIFYFVLFILLFGIFFLLLQVELIIDKKITFIMLLIIIVIYCINIINCFFETVHDGY